MIINKITYAWNTAMVKKTTYILSSQKLEVLQYFEVVIWPDC